MTKIGDIEITIKSEEMDKWFLDINNKLHDILDAVKKSRAKEFVASFYRSLELIDRQSGRSTALAEAALKIDGIFVVSTEDQKRECMEKFPDLDIRTINPHSFFGARKPIILDHYVVHQLLGELL